MLKLYDNRSFVIISAKDSFIEFVKRYETSVDNDYSLSKRIYTFDDTNVECRDDLIALIKNNYMSIVNRELSFFIENCVEIEYQFDDFIRWFSFEIVELGFDCSNSDLTFIDESEF